MESDGDKGRLEEIKNRLSDYYVRFSPYTAIELSIIEDVKYLLNRLEAAELAAKNSYEAGRQEALSYMIEEFSLLLEELKRKKEVYK